MTQETLGYVRLEWTCQRCGGKNPGPEKLCIHCGASLDEQDQFELPEAQEFITDAEELKKAAAGPDIHCPYCETRNPAGSTVCKQCGGSLAEGQVRARGHVVGACPELVLSKVEGPRRRAPPKPLERGSAEGRRGVQRTG